MSLSKNLSKYKVPRFDVKTSEEELKNYWQQWILAQPHKKWKIGVCFVDRLQKRYTISSKYKILSVDSIFASCTSSTALKLEPVLIKLAFDTGHCNNSHREQSETQLGYEERQAYIYCAELRENLVSCPIAKCSYVSSMDFMKVHLITHEHYNVVKRAIDGMDKTLIPQKILDSITPKVYMHRNWHSTSCEWCGENFLKADGNNPDEENKIARSLLASHRSTCPKNQISTFSCMEENCNQKSLSLADHRKHQNKHKEKVRMQNKTGIYVCRHTGCGARYDKVKQRTTHEKIHKPDEQRLIHKCHHCEKTFGRPDSRNRHGQKIHKCNLPCCNPKLRL